MTRAPEYLEAARLIIARRAQHRDAPDGERSMARAVQAFNCLHGAWIAQQGGRLTEAQGWAFMELLKHSRWAGGAVHDPDDHIDRAAYVALTAEAAEREAIRRAPDERG